MRITQANIEAAREALDRIREAWDEIESEVDLWMEAQESGSGVDPEDRQAARERIEEGLPEIETALTDALAVVS